MRVLLADDERAVRLALQLLLEQQAALEVVGEARDAGDLLAGVARLQPDLILLDWELPGLGVAPLAALRAAGARLVIVMSSRPEAKAAALAAGADGFVSKGQAADGLLAVVAQVMIGGQNDALCHL